MCLELIFQVCATRSVNLLHTWQCSAQRGFVWRLKLARPTSMKTMIFGALIFGWLLVLAKAEFKCKEKIDMAILLDSSGSVPEEVFDKTKKFAGDLVKHFDISKKAANIAIISYSQYVQVLRKFDEEVSTESVLKAIEKASYEGSFTRLDSALEIVQYKLFKKEQGARSSKKGVKKVIVAVTDGFSSFGIEFTKKLAGSLKRTGFELFSVGTSDLLYKTEMDELVSKPRKSHELLRDLNKSYFTEDEVEQFAKEICDKE